MNTLESTDLSRWYENGLIDRQTWRILNFAGYKNLGDFDCTSIAELSNVPGIGEKRVLALSAVLGRGKTWEEIDVFYKKV